MLHLDEASEIDEHVMATLGVVYAVCGWEVVRVTRKWHGGLIVGICRGEGQEL